MSRTKEGVSSSKGWSKITAPFQENRGGFILLSSFLIVAIAFYIQAQTLDRADSRTVPVFILYFFTVMIFFTAIMELVGHRIKERLELSNATTGFGFQDDEELSGTEESAALFELNPLNVTKHFIWICGYVFFISYVGFWVGNLLFIVSYILIYEQSSLSRRIPYAAGWAVLLLGVMWILFVELLNIVAIWRLGPLP